MVRRVLMESGQLDEEERHGVVIPAIAQFFDKQFVERVISELSGVCASLIPDDAADGVAEPWVQQGVEQRRRIVGRCRRRHVVACLRRIRADREIVRDGEQTGETKPRNALDCCLSEGYGEVHVIRATSHVMIVRHDGDDVVARMRHTFWNCVAAHVGPVDFRIASR